MIMRRIDEFTLEKIDSESKDLEASSRLYHQGRETGRVLQGLELSAQFQGNDYYLLFLTEDCPFEEGLFIYHLDSGFKVLDRAEISNPLTPGILEDLHIENEREISFTFFSKDEKWVLSVLPQPKRVLTAGLAAPVKRPLKLGGKRYFELRFEEKSSNSAARDNGRQDAEKLFRGEAL